MENILPNIQILAIVHGRRVFDRRNERGGDINDLYVTCGLVINDVGDGNGVRIIIYAYSQSSAIVFVR